MALGSPKALDTDSGRRSFDMLGSPFAAALTVYDGMRAGLGVDVRSTRLGQAIPQESPEPQPPPDYSQIRAIKAGLTAGPDLRPSE